MQSSVNVFGHRDWEREREREREYLHMYALIGMVVCKDRPIIILRKDKSWKNMLLDLDLKKNRPIYEVVGLLSFIRTQISLTTSHILSPGHWGFSLQNHLNTLGSIQPACVARRCSWLNNPTFTHCPHRYSFIQLSRLMQTIWVKCRA